MPRNSSQETPVPCLSFRSGPASYGHFLHVRESHETQPSSNSGRGRPPALQRMQMTHQTACRILGPMSTPRLSLIAPVDCLMLSEGTFAQQHRLIVGSGCGRVSSSDWREPSLWRPGSDDEISPTSHRPRSAAADSAINKRANVVFPRLSMQERVPMMNNGGSGIGMSSCMHG